jgi:hypothetical protein
MDDATAFQHYGLVGYRQDLTRVLLNQKDRHAARAHHLSDNAQKLLDDERSQPLKGLVEQEKGGIENERPADCQHLLLAARKLVAKIPSSFAQWGEKFQHA